MSTLIASRKQRAKVKERMRLMHEAAKSENRDFSDAENGHFEEMGVSVRLLDDSIKNIEGQHRAEDDEARAGFARGDGVVGCDPDSRSLGGRGEKRVSYQGVQCREWHPTKQQDLDNLDDGEFYDFAEFGRAVRDTKEGRNDSRLEKYDSRSQSTFIGSAGVFLVPERFETETIMSIHSREPQLALRRIFIVENGQPTSFATLDDGDRSNDEVAGVKASRTGENVTMTQDQIILGKSRFDLSKAATLVQISNELLSDGVGTDAALRSAIAKTYALTQAKDTMTGSGAGEPLGIEKSPDHYDAVDVSAAGTLKVDDLAEMLSRLEGGGNENTAWVCHSSVLKALLLTVAGSNTAPAWSPFAFGGAAEARPTSLLGFPLFVSDSCKTLNTVGDIVLGNWHEYIYMMQPMRIETSPHVYFDKDAIAFRAVLRDAGMPWRASTMTDRQSFTVSNFIRLQTRT